MAPWSHRRAPLHHQSHGPAGRANRSSGILVCPFCGALQGEDVVEVEAELVEAGRVSRRGGRAARQSLWNQLAQAKQAADPLAELQRIATAHGHRSAWTDQMRRVLQI